MTTYESYVDLIGHIDDLVAVFEQHPDPATREQAIALLSGLDALHRQGLERLLEILRAYGGDVLIERAADDPVVEIFLGLYDLVKLDLPEESPARPPQGFVALDDLDVLDDAYSPEMNQQPPDE